VIKKSYSIRKIYQFQTRERNV